MRTFAFFTVITGCLIATGALAAQDGTPLFNGKNLDGWKASENPGTFKVEDGAIVAHGPRAHLFYNGPVNGASFKNFELSVEVKAAAGANSGVYFHTAFQDKDWPAAGFEVQVNNSAVQHGDYLERKKTGSLYGIRNVYKQMAADDTWFTMKIAVKGNRVQVRVDDVLLVDYLEIPSMAPRGLGKGTFALQGHDPDSRVSFRNIRVKALSDDLPMEPLNQPLDASYKEVLRLGGANYPVVDFHTHLKGGLTLEEVLAHMHQTGINHGLAVNCGLGFAITNDAGIGNFVSELKRTPVFAGMQAEGREWVRLFSPAAIAQFDYVFTDSMTIFNPQGKRMRLWIKEEVEVGDKQAFMENLVGTIEKIFASEPVDIYVNPTFLPDEIAGEYATLWTPERQQRVIDAAVKNNVAIEINSRYELPKADFIKAAKKAGLKFTIGTNNVGQEIISNEYGFRMIRECGLTWQDMWMPRPPAERKVHTWKAPR